MKRSLVHAVRVVAFGMLLGVVLGVLLYAGYIALGAWP